MNKKIIYLIQIILTLISLACIGHYTHYTIQYFLPKFSVILTIMFVPMKLLCFNLYFLTINKFIKKITFVLNIVFIVIIGILHILINVDNTNYNFLFEIIGISVYIYMLKTYPLTIST